MTFGIKKGPCETLPFFSFSSPFPLPFLSLSFPFPSPFPFLSLSSSFPFLFPVSSFPFSCPFSFPFSFPFAFFRFPFLFLSLSFFFSLSLSFCFPILSFPFLYWTFFFSLSSLMWILWSRCEASAWKKDKRKKHHNVWKNHLKGLGVFTTPHILSGILFGTCSDIHSIWHPF